VAQTLLLMLAVWWVWICTTWATNWLNPERRPVRLVLMALMLLGLILSSSIPKAIESRGLAFAGAYVAMQVGRTLFFLWAVRGHPSMVHTFQRILVWLVFSGIFWIAGGLVHHPARLGLWMLAVGLEYLSPSLGFRVPGLGRSTTNDWNVEGGHMAERCGLFIIIALGESILVTGATFSGLPWTPAAVTAFMRRSWAAWPCGGCTSTPAPPWQATPSQRREIPASSPAWPTPTFTCSWSPVSSWRPWPTSSCWPIR
jgi:low temperature requirement protein LtrA